MDRKPCGQDRFGGSGSVAPSATTTRTYPISGRLPWLPTPLPTLVRLAGPVGVDDLSDEVYTLVAAHVADREAVVITHVVLHDRPAIEVAVTDDAVSRAVVRSVIEEIVAESDRLVALWHPDLPETGA